VYLKQKLFRKISVGILALSLIISIGYFTDLGAQIYFGISPVRVEHKLTPGKKDTYAIEIMNRGPFPLRIKVYVADWYLKDDGTPVFVAPGQVDYSCTGWIKTNPQDFRLSPDQNKVVRYQVSVPDVAEKGGYWTGICFENVLPETPGEKPRAVFSKGRIVAIVYVRVGKVIPEGEIKNIETSLKEEFMEFEIKIENTGRTYFRIKGELEIKDHRGKVAAKIKLPDVPVLRESQRIIKLKLDKKLPPGNYLAFCKLDIGREELIGLKKSFSVPEK